MLHPPVFLAVYEKAQGLEWTDFSGTLVVDVEVSTISCILDTSSTSVPIAGQQSKALCLWSRLMTTDRLSSIVSSVLPVRCKLILRLPLETPYRPQADKISRQM